MCWTSSTAAEDILTAFRTYYQTATLADVTDPNLVFDLRAKLDAQGHYDDYEVDRVVRIELDPKATHADLVAAISPVADRLLKAWRRAGAESSRRGRADEGGPRRPGHGWRRWPCSAPTWRRSCAPTASCRRSSTTATRPSRPGRSSTAV
jgi:hypothetical protein